ncbi:sodium:proton symporter [Leptospira perolatii]|uniref:Sodium:proton symporter n=1 Tax=Leptospira perolatii TaxID=2023191 RepID=A0A2M9ZLX6_9LEPT|nr:bile acid:sodium symporter family protein [Leptospira perolatii]PJZ69164.1 sodium:proton symporter [Leptospira perolatii]PJZ73092.1 sodium:proton symporter [Leptospira perolatii]
MQFGVVEKTLLPALLAIVMLGMGLSLAVSDFKRIVVTPVQVLVGSIGHFVIMPIAAYIVILILGLDYELALGVIIVGSCPSGTTSNLINYWAKGDVALAVVITSLSTLLCPLLTPMIVTSFGSLLDASTGGSGKPLEVSFLEMLKLVVAVIAVPIGIGMTVNHRYPDIARAIEKPYKIFSVSFLVFVVGFIIFKNRSEFLNMLLLVGGAVILHNILGFVLGYFIPKLMRIPERQSRTISIEVAIQNTTLGMTLAVDFFGDRVALPAAVFSLWMYFAGTVMAVIWSRYLPLPNEESA